MKVFISLSLVSESKTYFWISGNFMKLKTMLMFRTQNAYLGHSPTQTLPQMKRNVPCFQVLSYKDSLVSPGQ